MPWSGRGSTRRWRALRAQILSRDNYTCQIKLSGCAVTATQVHHIKGAGTSDSPEHLQAACGNCNAAIGDPARHNPGLRRATTWGP